MATALTLPCLLPIPALVTNLRKKVKSLIFVISEYDAAQPSRWCKHQMESLYIHLQTLLVIAVPAVWHYRCTRSKTGRKTCNSELYTAPTAS